MGNNVRSKLRVCRQAIDGRHVRAEGERRMEMNESNARNEGRLGCWTAW